MTKKWAENKNKKKMEWTHKRCANIVKWSIASSWSKWEQREIMSEFIRIKSAVWKHRRYKWQQTQTATYNFDVQNAYFIVIFLSSAFFSSLLLLSVFCFEICLYLTILPIVCTSFPLPTCSLSIIRSVQAFSSRIPAIAFFLLCFVRPIESVPS